MEKKVPSSLHETQSLRLQWSGVYHSLIEPKQDLRRDRDTIKVSGLDRIRMRMLFAVLEKVNMRSWGLPSSTINRMTWFIEDGCTYPRASKTLYNSRKMTSTAFLCFVQYHCAEVHDRPIFVIAVAHLNYSRIWLTTSDRPCSKPHGSEHSDHLRRLPRHPSRTPVVGPNDSQIPTGRFVQPFASPRVTSGPPHIIEQEIST